ncbi:MAG TPA: hypothetical protein VK447_19140 [Myxococcaceae bacterium]|nr:hypothetical protein [Myxococcaceae bacterium]
MLVPALGLLLAASPHLAVVVVDDAGQPKVAGAAVSALEGALDAEAVGLGAYLKAQGPACRDDVRCLSAAPELGEVPRFLALGLRELPGGQLAANLRLVDRRLAAPVGRSAAVVDKAGLSAWATRSAARLIKASATSSTPRSLFPPGLASPVPPVPQAAPPPPRPSDAPRLAEPGRMLPSPPPSPAAPRKTEPEGEWSQPGSLPEAPRPTAPATPPPSKAITGDDK